MNTCASCKHWGADKRRKTHQVCAALSKWDSPLEAIGDGCAECETDQPVQIETPAGFGCIKWEPRE